jgi:uncharacterized protein YqhQ
VKTAGSSRKNGITLYGDRYAVTFWYDKKKQDYIYGLYPIADENGDTVKKIRQIPVIRGLYSIFRNPGMLASAGISALSAAGALLTLRDKKSMKILGGICLGAGYAYLGALFYHIFGTDGKVRQYHGAEHKVIEAYEKQKGRITQEQAEEASRISRRCGTNFIVYYFASQAAFGWLPLGHGVVQQGLITGLAYEGFRLPEEKAPALKEVLNQAGDLLQRYVTTAEPDRPKLEAARVAMNLLVDAESGKLSDDKIAYFRKNADRRPWIDKLIG